MRPGRPAIRLAAWNRAIPEADEHDQHRRSAGDRPKGGMVHDHEQDGDGAQDDVAVDRAPTVLAAQPREFADAHASHPSGVLPSVRSSSSESCT